jgi:hypothetical protein
MANWTPKDIKVLHDWYGKKPLAEIAAKVGRSRYAVGMYLAKHRAEFPHVAPLTTAQKKAFKSRGPRKSTVKKGGKK